MIPSLPSWLNLLFLATTALTIGIFYYANGRNKPLLLLIVGWSILQSLLAYAGFYQQTSALPPRFLLVLLPGTLLIMVGLLPGYRNNFLKNRDRTLSTFLHIVRIPVEITLFYLFVYKMVPELMTFEGRNFDILAGLSAPLIGALLIMKRAGNSLLIAWNLVSLCLVSFILLNGILSSELPVQLFAFEQPNRAILYFPFVLLPAVIVPIVLYTHITDLIILWAERKNSIIFTKKLTIK